jgi:hypothetical protein
VADGSSVTVGAATDINLAATGGDIDLTATAAAVGITAGTSIALNSGGTSDITLTSAGGDIQFTAQTGNKVSVAEGIKMAFDHDDANEYIVSTDGVDLSVGAADDIHLVPGGSVGGAAVTLPVNAKLSLDGRVFSCMFSVLYGFCTQTSNASGGC